MKLFNTLKLKFSSADYSKDPVLGVMDTILEKHPELLEECGFVYDITLGNKDTEFGRKGGTTVEQIVRAALYKEIKKRTYRELEYDQHDSRICACFIKLDEHKPFTFQMFQNYISRIKVETLQKFMVALNLIAIEEGYEGLKKTVQDSTVIENNIHYPTNNSLVWDCIKETNRLLSQLHEAMNSFTYRSYKKSAKRNLYKINNTKQGDKRTELFRDQLINFTKTINEVKKAIQTKPENPMAEMIQKQLVELLPVLNKIYDITKRKEIMNESVPNEEKIFSIYEQHTDIIVKGGREVQFGHKVNLTMGKSNMILDCDILQGNPSDTSLFQPAMERLTNNYNITPRDSSADGGYASKENLQYAKDKGIANVVFTKVKGSMQNIVSSLNIETRLKKWRSSAEAVISNLKRGFEISVCDWKGWANFQSKVLWSVIAYNFRVFTGHVLVEIVKSQKK